jgi:RNA ligase
MFPRIEQLSDLLPYVQSNQQIRVKPCETTGHTVVCYMVQDEDTFAGENLEYERECRGITFDENGKISARTMHKFFNIGERDETRPENIDWTRVVRVMEKRDGSMVTPVPIRGWKDKVVGPFKFKTKKSFTTPEAALADQVARETPGGEAWIQDLLRAGFTPTFEITSPRFPIVVRYEKDELTLLHIRDNATGQYVQVEALYSHFGACPFPIVDNLIKEFRGRDLGGGHLVRTAYDAPSWALLKHAAETREGMEGWVVQMDDGEMFKVKTKWYIELHHSVTFTRWRDVARTVCADQADDLKAAFAMVGRPVEPILEVERKIRDRTEHYRKVVESAAKAGQAAEFDAKTMAITYKDHPQFGLIMRAFRDQEINWMEYYERTHLDQDWSLEVIA